MRNIKTIAFIASAAALLSACSSSSTPATMSSVGRTCIGAGSALTRSAGYDLSTANLGDQAVKQLKVRALSPAQRSTQRARSEAFPT